MTRKGIVILLLLAALIWGWNGIAQHPFTQAQQSNHTSSMTLLAPARDASLQSAERVQGGPTISAAFTDRVLAAAHSPATGIGKTLYALSMKYHIDNAVALSFYHHESSYGTRGMAVLTRSWGNIRCTRGWVCDPSGGYRAYSSYVEGLEDWYQLIASDYLPRGLTTVATIIPVYAPAADHNDESAYIAAVLLDVVAFREGKVQR